ncbi:MAG: rhodanese-like domain-containing protein [Saprospiraceae bacterium]
MSKIVVSLTLGLLGLLLTNCTAQNATPTQILSVAEFKSKLQKDATVQLVDVRTPEEFAAGHIEGALNINYLGSDFEQQIQKLDKKRPVLLYCKSGIRSSKAAAILQKSGFSSLYNLEGGYLKWAAQ